MKSNCKTIFIFIQPENIDFTSINTYLRTPITINISLQSTLLCFYLFFGLFFLARFLFWQSYLIILTITLLAFYYWLSITTIATYSCSMFVLLRLPIFLQYSTTITGSLFFSVRMTSAIWSQLLSVSPLLMKSFHVTLLIDSLFILSFSFCPAFG